MPTSPPSGATVVMQAEADRAEPEPLARVEHQHRPRGAERDVEDEDGQHERPHGGVVPHPADALGDVVPDVRSRAGRSLPCGGSAMRETSTAPAATSTACAAERPAAPDGEQRRAERRADELVDRDEPGLQPGVRQRQVVAVRPASAAACCDALSANDLGGAQQEQRDEHQRRSTRRPSRRRAASTARTTARAGRRSTTMQPPVEPVGQRAGAQPEQQRRQPLERRGQRDQERVVVSEATSSGPAARAMPSPRFVVHDDASSHRNPVAEPGRRDDLDDPAHEEETLARPGDASSHSRRGRARVRPAGVSPAGRRWPGRRCSRTAPGPGARSS